MLDSKIRIGVLIYAYMMDVCDYIEKQRLNAYSLHPAIEFVDQALVDEAKEKRL